MARDILVCCELAVIVADFVLGLSHLSPKYFSEVASTGAEARKRRGFLPPAWDSGTPSLWEQRFGASCIIMRNPSYLVAGIVTAEG